ncbi:MAG: hypothetical protein ACHP7H_00735 [Hyphomicrobiales bacterium]
MKTPILFALAFSLLACSGAAFDVAPGDAAGASVEYSSDASPPGASDADAMSSPGEEMLIARAEAGPDAQPSPEVLGDGSSDASPRYQADASPAEASDAGADVDQAASDAARPCSCSSSCPASKTGQSIGTPCCLTDGGCGCALTPGAACLVL